MRSTDVIPVAVCTILIIFMIGFMVVLFINTRRGIIEEQPPSTTQEINAGQIAREFVFNWSKAMQSYQDQWFTVNAGPVNRVASRRATIEYEGVTLKMYFNSRDDTWAIEPDQDITAVCKLTNARAHNRSITMKGCRWPTPEPKYPRRNP